MLRRLLAVTAVAGCLVIGPTAAQEKDKDWVQLFNGKDLTGWKIHPAANGDFAEIIPLMKDGKLVGYDAQTKDKKQRDDSVKKGERVHLWRVEDGLLIGSGPHSHLFSERGDYKDFHFKVECMINDKGNSGQYFRTKFEGGFPRGFEAQINATHGDPIKTGSLYPDYRQPDMKEVKSNLIKEAAHKPGEWFTQEVICVGDKVTILVNGKKSVEWTDPKARFKEGHFALQGHDPGSVVKFRKVEVKELP